MDFVLTDYKWKIVQHASCDFHRTFHQFWGIAIKNRNQSDRTDCEWMNYSSYVETGNFDSSHIHGQGLRNILISAFVRSPWPASTPACRPMQLQLKWSLDEFSSSTLITWVNIFWSYMYIHWFHWDTFWGRKSLKNIYKIRVLHTELLNVNFSLR